MEVAKTELENLNRELIDAQFELKQRREFDKLAKQILKFPSQEESLKYAIHQPGIDLSVWGEKSS